MQVYAMDLQVYICAPTIMRMSAGNKAGKASK
jgi:hypothetical protein